MSRGTAGSLVLILLYIFHILALTEADRPAFCSLPFEYGTRCRGRFPRWWFNLETETCQKKIYGGCDKNDNHFLTRNDCAATCQEKVTVPLHECYQRSDKGQGHGWLLRYYYNYNKQKCLRFIYRGKGGNSNRFRSREECSRRCML
uniref:Kunitz-type serine protease inhibitor textilinin-2-like n=1 Tax=Crassostrea virginica TaxID=6565 RepID=A0A8B8C448_CRAVI|nr:kunitz-type serine protease inhibitor textilinin-2-like [Crassostrea virginica]